MQRNHFLNALMAAISLVGFVSAVGTSAADETKRTKPDQQQPGDKTTTKSKLEGQKKGEGDAAFKELNQNAPGGAKAAPKTQGSGGGQQVRRIHTLLGVGISAPDESQGTT